MRLDIEEVKDVFIHFEENGYTTTVKHQFFKIGSNSLIYDLPAHLKRIINNEKISICDAYTISLTGKKSVIKFKEWTEVQINLDTAIKRLNKYGYTIDNSMTINQINLLLTSLPIVELKNIKELNLLRKSFNSHNIGKIEYTVNNKFTIKVIKMSDTPISKYRELLENDFDIKELTIDGQILNRKGEVSKDQRNGAILEIIPKNFEIFI